MKSFVLALVVSLGSSTSSFADSMSPYPQPNEPSRGAFTSISDLFKNAGTAVSKELSKLSDSVRSHADLPEYEKMSPSYSKRYQDDVEAAATHFSVPEPFLACLINIESSYESHAISPMGAMGIMQFMKEAVVAFNQQIRDDAYSKAAWGTYPFKSGKVPVKLSFTDVWNPDIMIPAGALRFKARALLLFGEFGVSNWSLSQTMLLVADYDMGPIGLARLCRYRSPRDSRDLPPLESDLLIDACMNDLNPKLNPKAPHETWAEMEQVSSCMVGMPSALGRMLKKTF
jgi:hypothetical protein